MLTAGACCDWLVGFVHSAIVARIGCRASCLLGGVVLGVGCCLSSLAPTIYVMCLTYGFVYGESVCACCCVYRYIVLLDVALYIVQLMMIATCTSHVLNANERIPRAS